MSRRVLVVDDEKLIVKGLRFSLEQEGYDVDCAYDGGEAIDMIRRNDYAVILLDVMLPVMSGYEVCQAVREFSDTPIIMLTAKTEDIDKIMGLEYGADDYITKPFNILEVKARIKAIIRRSNRPEREESRPKTIEYGDLLACLGGMILAFNWKVFLIMLFIELVLAIVIDYICVVPITASIAYPAVYGLMTANLAGALIILVATAAMLWKHLENLKRIRQGTELHFSYLWSKNKEHEKTRIIENVRKIDETQVNTIWREKK